MSSAYHQQQALQYEYQASILSAEIEALQEKVNLQEDAISAFGPYQAGYTSQVREMDTNLSNIASYSPVEVLSYRAQELRDSVWPRRRAMDMLDGCNSIKTMMQAESIGHQERLENMRADLLQLQSLAESNWSSYHAAKAEEDRARAKAEAAASR